ncbi:hypothetical protein [Roseivirga echinicomitans]|uniref:Uncharacterized protein n=1 Tax=Roseivirga echinicomitans TaxID=296218 RepID=A0A150XNQ9_9BACT|nr:hypothetical protein [Roseivirga echinicomitans]KYG80222.1 hypothetical protein AWN68_17115 [Roseivirga echinicomitans]
MLSGRRNKRNSSVGTILAFGILILIGSCSDIYEQKEVEYLLPKGQHMSKRLGGFPNDKSGTLKSDVLDFTARFDESVRYDLGNRNQDDINKLFGFSDCNSLHHENSVRFGWRYSLVKDMVEIFSYAYTNGVVGYHHMGDIAIRETAHYQIQIVGDKFYLLLNGEMKQEVERGTNCEVGLYYKLYPYFGGDEPAPHDISIYIKEIFTQ